MAIFPSPQPEADSGLTRSSSSLGHDDLATATEGFGGGGGGDGMGWESRGDVSSPLPSGVRLEVSNYK